MFSGVDEGCNIGVDSVSTGEKGDQLGESRPSGGKVQGNGKVHQMLCGHRYRRVFFRRESKFLINSFYIFLKGLVGRKLRWSWEGTKLSDLRH